MSVICTTLTESQIQILRDSGSIVTVGRETDFYFLPYWFERLSRNGNQFKMHLLGDLPEELKELIREQRGEKRPEQDKELVEGVGNMLKAFNMINECLESGIPIEKNDPIHQKIKRLLTT